MNEGIKKLQKEWNEEPVKMLIVGSLVVTAGAKLLKAYGDAKGRRTWDREVSRRMRKQN